MHGSGARVNEQKDKETPFQKQSTFTRELIGIIKIFRKDL